MAKAAKKTKPPAPAFEIIDCEQNSPEWFEARLGIPTASRFSTILAAGEGREKLLARLAGEIMTGFPAETFRNKAMDRGLEMEPDARAHYERTRLVDLQKIGFVRRRLPSGRFVGCSPDAFVGSHKILEIKTMIPEELIPLWKKGARGVPTKHLAQVQGCMWICEREVCDLMIYYRGIPVAPSFTIERSDVFIKEIDEQVQVFDYDLNKMVAEVRAQGGES